MSDSTTDPSAIYADTPDIRHPSTSVPVKRRQLASQDAYLAAYAISGEVFKSCDAAGINHDTHRDWVQQDAQGFKAREDEAGHRFREALQSRAIARIDDPKGNRGSDVLLITMMNAWWPERYKPGVIDTSSVAKDVMAEFRKAKKEWREGKAMKADREDKEDRAEGARELLERIKAKRSK